MNISKIRSALYKISRILGDINAAKKGTAGKRIGRRAAGKITGKGLKKLFK
ncbi:hypothetical protein [Salibacterium aidingense]|uniref:hypothetical protein n=1 Tax=Salibacterium aidingense TaxID=384933 RepID=UPI0004253882|nr:hypothetical protein [Salibacterium aidingense]